MSAPRLIPVLQQLRSLVRPPDAGLTDAQLLSRWLASRDEAAFEVLIWRHGPTVLGVCQRLLRRSQDIEDAFQATFLVFIRKAGGIGKRDAVASWLYKVAYRVALQARQRTARQHLLDGHDVLVPDPRTNDAVFWRDIRPVLDEEVNGLPVRYRTVFVLCCLEGKTNEQAAREIGVPIGTVLSRLSRARARLRSRLTRRGVTLSAAAIAAGWASQASASVPASLVGSTIKAALVGVAEQAAVAGVVSVQAAALTKGALHVMWLTKMQTTAALALSVALIGGGSAFTYRTMAAGPPDEPSRVAASDDPTQVRENNQKTTAERLRAAMNENRRLSALLEKTVERARQYQAQAMVRERKLRDLTQRVKELEATLTATGFRSRASISATPPPPTPAVTAPPAITGTVTAAPPAVSISTPPTPSVSVATPPVSPDPATVQSTSTAPPPPTVPRTTAGPVAPPSLDAHPSTSGVVSASVLEDAHDAVELTQAQLRVKKAELTAAMVDVRGAQRDITRVMHLDKTGAISSEDVNAAKDKVARLEAAVEVKHAEVQEQEIRLRQAKRRWQRLRELSKR